MWKTVLAGTTVLAIAGGSFVYAQQRPDEPFARAERWRPSAEDIGAFGDARIAGLKAGLRLTADQEKNWPAFEQALRDRAKMRADRFAARQGGEQRSADPIERLRRRAEMITQTGTTLKALADSAAPLYSSLDDAQKQRFMVLARLERHREWRAHHGPGMMGSGGFMRRGPGGPEGPGGMMERGPRQ